MANTDESPNPKPPMKAPRPRWGARFFSYVKSKLQERITKKQEESPGDRAVRLTAVATIWMAIFTFALAGTSGITIWILKNQLKEMHEGGTDTHDLASAAKTQAEKIKSMSDAADKIRQAAQDMVAQDQRIADNAEKSLAASNKQSKAALNASISASQQSNALAREALEAQTRPWLGIDNGLTPGSSGRDENGRRNATFSFSLRDYGQSPAMKAAYSFQFSSDLRTNAAREASTCKEASERSTVINTASNPVATMNLLTIFPGDSGVIGPIKYSPEVDVFPQFLVGCIAYQGQTSGMVHTTRVVYSIRQDKVKGQIFDYIAQGTTTQ